MTLDEQVAQHIADHRRHQRDDPAPRSDWAEALAYDLQAERSEAEGEHDLAILCRRVSAALTGKLRRRPPAQAGGGRRVLAALIDSVYT